jgi:hypothetical protein
MAFRKPAAATKETVQFTITAPNFKILQTTLVGTAPYISNSFADEADNMAADQALGEKAKTGRAKKPPKDFEKGFRNSLHRSKDGKWYGIPAMAFKQALVRACSVAGIEMTKAKMCLFVLADGSGDDGAQLVRFTKGKPEMVKRPVRNANGGPDIRARGEFDAGWECVLRVKYDADLFSLENVANLINRAGISVGVGAGRPFSTMSCGIGCGTFEMRDAVHETAK